MAESFFLQTYDVVYISILDFGLKFSNQFDFLFHLFQINYHLKREIKIKLVWKILSQR